MKKSQVVIMGAGRIGKALGACLKPKAEVVLWDIDPSLISHPKPLSELVPKADFLFLCVPTFALCSAIDSFKPLLGKRAIIVCLSKGIEEKTKFTTDQVLSRCLPKGQAFVVLGGPMLAEELVPKQGGVAVAGTKSLLAVRELQGLFSGTCVFVESSSDVHGVALCGVLKNIYALGLGAIEGLGWPDNFMGWYVAAAAQEMRRILSILGGNEDTIFTAAGLGDFIATGFSKHSGHHTIGVARARGQTCALDRDGCRSMVPLFSLLGAKKKNFPLLLFLSRVFVQGKNARREFEMLKKV